MSEVRHELGGTSLRRFKPYPAYKGSGVDWLGEIPAGWGIKRLKRIVQFRGGGTPAKDNLEYWGGDIPWVSPKDMKVSVVLDTEDKITAQALRESATNLVPAGAVLVVVRSGILAHSVPVALSGCEVTLNQDLKALIPRSELLPRYLMYLISGMQRELLVEWKKEGATVESLELELVASTPTPLPAIAEQRAITTFLDRETARIDALVAKKERLIELLQEKRTALITRAVTKGLDPKVPMKDSGVEWLGEIPAHWEPMKIKRLFRQTKRQEHADLTVLSVYRDYGVVEKSSRDDNFNRTPEDLDSYQLVNVGDLVINKMKAWQGSLGVSQLSGITSPDYAVFSPHHSESGRFLHHFLRNKLLTNVYLTMSNGIRPSQWRLEPERFEDLTVFVPTRTEQTKICEYVDHGVQGVSQLIERVETAVNCLEELRTALISAAVTGKIDVREEVAA